MQSQFQSAAPLQVPPHSLEAEMAVLGSMLIEKEAVEKAIEVLDETQFYLHAHKLVFKAFAELCKAERGVDLITTAEELRKRGDLEAAGGRDYLIECMHKVATAAHIDYYARIVHEKSLLRELIKTASRVIGDCYLEEDPAALLDSAQTEILAVAQKETANRFAGTEALMHDAVEKLEKLHHRGQHVTGIPTGFKEIDRMTGGMQPGDLILIAARPSQGKTALALNIATNVILKKELGSVAFFSMEMSKEALASRLVAAVSGTSLQSVRSGYFRRDQWVQLTEAAARIAEAHLFIDDSPGLSVLEVRGRARRLAADQKKKGHPLCLVMIDYLQLMRGSSRRSENRQQEVAEISRGLKFLARDLGVPVVALSQLKRADDKGRADGRPRLSDLRESGSLEQDADLVAMIYREAADKPHDPSVDKNKAELIIAKQRQGPTGSVDLYYNAELTRFNDLDPHASTPPEDQQGTFE
jgi:replicative DNA helicase